MSSYLFGAMIVKTNSNRANTGKMIDMESLNGLLILLDDTANRRMAFATMTPVDISTFSWLYADNNNPASRFTATKIILRNNK